MKTRLLPLSRRGFTLIEIMTVITIITMLTALTFVGIRSAQTKAAKKNTVARISGLVDGLASYKNDNGEYPESVGDETVTVNNTAFKVGGARMLYQVVTGDGNSGIRGGGTPSTGNPGSTGKVYWDEVTPPTEADIAAKRRKPMVDKGEDGSFYMIDGWRKPFQYLKMIKDRNKRISNLDQVHSDGDYEIWSYGELKTAAEDSQSQREWIASWGVQ
jgi:prepilin-type N-terminal cleavage/methylation domain-containing protein